MGQETLKSVDVLTEAQTITAAFADVGDEINTHNCKALFLWVDITDNDSSDLQVKVLAKRTKGATVEYVLPGQLVDGTAVIDVLDEPYQLYADAKVCFKVDLDIGIPFVQIQMKAGTLGSGTDGTVDSVYAGLVQNGA